MLIIPAKCTECGGILQINQEKDGAVCPHCNTPFFIRKAADNHSGTIAKNDFTVRAGELIKYKGSDVDIVIPGNVISIASEAFSGCDQLRSIEIPGSVQKTAPYSLSSCRNLTHITIQEGADRIVKLENCRSLVSVTIPDSIKVIEENTFSDCRNLKNIIIPDSIVTIRKNAFRNCRKLKNITIPDSVKAIENYAFINCSSLKSIIIPNDGIYIWKDAFYGCSNLDTVNGLPAAENSIFGIMLKKNKKILKLSNSFSKILAPCIAAGVFGVFAFIKHSGVGAAFMTAAAAPLIIIAITAFVTELK